MTFYKIIQKPEALVVRLSNKNPDKKFYPKWRVIGQNLEQQVAIHEMLPEATIGLYIQDGTIYRIFDEETVLRNQQHPGELLGIGIPCVVLLIGERMFFVPKQCVIMLTDKEIERVCHTP